jgi:hypothetical protein
MEQVSPYLSDPKADFTPNYESVAVKRSLDRSIEQEPTIYPTERKRSLINPVVDQ